MMARAIIVLSSVTALTLLATRELVALLAIVFIAAFLFALGVIGLTADLIRKGKQNGAYRR